MADSNSPNAASFNTYAEAPARNDSTTYCPSACIDNMMIFDPKVITNPAGVRSVEWLKTLKPDFVKMDVPTFKQ